MIGEIEVIKANWLQQKVRKKSGTLLRKKKKVRYEEAEWVVLCVHNNRIPLLEWYPTEEHASDHRPLRVTDLLNSTYVSPVISDSRCFIIGFSDEYRDSLELAALSAEDCSDWVHCSVATLRRLKCLSEPSNVYTAFPEKFDSGMETLRRSSPEFERPVYLPNTSADEVPSPTTPIVSSVQSFEYVYLPLDVRCASSSISADKFSPFVQSGSSPQASGRRSFCETVSPPPLPPRTPCLPLDPSLPNIRRAPSSVYDLPKNCISPPPRYDSLNTSSASRDEKEECSVSSPQRPSEYGMISSPISLSSLIEAPSEAGTSKSALLARGYSIPSGNPGPPQRTLSHAHDGYVTVLSSPTSPTTPMRLSSLIPPRAEQQTSKEVLYEKLNIV